jgi:hypothetical protein
LHAPKDRHEWVRIVRRARLGSTTTFVALMLSTYGNADGTRIFPGEQILAAVCELSDRSVRSSLKRLRDIGLIERVRQGNPRRGLADEYRLTVPTDLIEFVDMLSPDESPERGSGGRGSSPERGSGGQLSAVGSPPETDDSTTGNSRQHHRKLTTAPPERGSAHQTITTHVPPTDQPTTPVLDVTTDRARENGHRP